MDSPIIWTIEDALARRCSVDMVGCVRPEIELSAVTPLPGERPDVAAAKRLAPYALMQLARLASGDGRAAVEACKELLHRAYGAPAAAQLPVEGQTWPEWMTAQRLAYAVGMGRTDD